jgi:uncharacterized cupredoxin-like copper-binding protein
MSFLKATTLATVLVCGMAGIDTVNAAGDLTTRPERLAHLVMGSEQSDYSFSEKTYELDTGSSYRLKIISSGQKECAFQAPEFMQSIYLRKVEAGGIEVKAIMLTELEFEDAGQAEMFFVPIKPGRYPFFCKGLENKGMQGEFVVK